MRFFPRNNLEKVVQSAKNLVEKLCFLKSLLVNLLTVYIEIKVDPVKVSVCCLSFFIVDPYLVTKRYLREMLSAIFLEFQTYDGKESHRCPAGAYLQ